MEKNTPVDRRFRLARQWSNRELNKIAHLFYGDVVNVSAGENIDKEGRTYDSYFVNARTFYLTNYAPGTFRGFQGRENEYLVDLTKELPAELERRFDVAFNHTVLEHIFDVRTAFRNLCNLSRDVVIVVVPFAQQQHDTQGYQDYWRFAPNSLRQLFRENGFEVIYESCNHDADAAVYLFFVASRQAGKWQGLIPSYEPISEAGSWIGSLRLLENATVKDCLRQVGRIISAKFRSGR